MTTKLANDVNVTGNRLRHFLALCGLSQAELAEQSGIGRQIISKIINDKCVIVSSVTAELICRPLVASVIEVFPNAGQR